MKQVIDKTILNDLDFMPYFSFLEGEDDKYVGIVFGYIFRELLIGNSKVSKNKIAKTYSIGRNRVSRVMSRLEEMGLIDGVTSSTKEDLITINHKKLKILARDKNNSTTNFKDLLDN